MIKLGYDIEMVDKDGQPLNVGKHFEGGMISDSEEAEISITYNYAWFFYKFIDPEKGLRWVYGKKGKDCVDRIQKAIGELMTTGMGNGDKPYKDYWAPTPGNVKRVLDELLRWCKLHPEGIFRGD